MRPKYSYIYTSFTLNSLGYCHQIIQSSMLTCYSHKFMWVQRVFGNARETNRIIGSFINGMVALTDRQQIQSISFQYMTKFEPCRRYVHSISFIYLFIAGIIHAAVSRYWLETIWLFKHRHHMFLNLSWTTERCITFRVEIEYAINESAAVHIYNRMNP